MSATTKRRTPTAKSASHKGSSPKRGAAASSRKVVVSVSLLLVLGLMTRTVAACMGFVMAGAAGFVHVRHGVFVADGGWELVGAIAGALLALAAAGPGRCSVAHLGRARAKRPPAPAALPLREPVFVGPEPEIPPPGLPVTPLIRMDPHGRLQHPGPPPLRHR